MFTSKLAAGVGELFKRFHQSIRPKEQDKDGTAIIAAVFAVGVQSAHHKVIGVVSIYVLDAGGGNSQISVIEIDDGCRPT